MAYMERMIAATESRPDLFLGGTITDFDVKHDDWCQILTLPDVVKQKLYNACTCNPDIFFVIDGQRYRVTERGHVVKVG